MIIDDIQRQPELLAILKRISEDPNRQARFLLFGSTSPELIQRVSESLSRTVRFIDASGFSLDEIGYNNQNRLWFRGGLPRSYLSKDDDAARRWLDSFVRSYLERDVLLIDPRTNPALVERFMGMLAHRQGYTWNASEISGSLGSRDRIVNRFRDILLGSLMIRSLPAWLDNLGKRIIKSPKIYLRDSGIHHYLLGLTSFSELSTHPSFGSSWEGFALEQTLIAHGAHDSYFYRTQRGTELDLLLLRKGKRWGFEFKCTDAPRTSKSMHIAIKDLELEHLWTIYPGTLSYSLTESITVLPLRDVTSLTF
ncbi:MAG: ATP-binding protein [Gammaproteobacteria bacterium]|nr:ATP-binding protein [Gammaproteobacteria bacterium]